MSYAAYKMMHWPTGVENCASGFFTHSISDSTPPSLLPSDDLDSDWPRNQTITIGPVPNLVISVANVLELYVVRLQQSNANSDAKRGALVAGVSAASLELVAR
ncbi:Cleavage and polyadenylation specificity factor subunit 1 [Bienertia sinuspersici]